MSTPGSYDHLEHLGSLDLTALQGTDVDTFLQETNASKTLAVFIKRNRIFRPIRSPHIELDTRILDATEIWIPLFHGSIYRNPNQPGGGLLQIHGRPQPWESGEDNYTYDLTIPMDYDFNYNASRPVSAGFNYGDELLNRRQIYNQAAFSEYGEDDPTVLYGAIKQAAVDLAMLARFIHGIDRRPGYIEQGPNIQTSRARVAQTIANLLK